MNSQPNLSTVRVAARQQGGWAIVSTMIAIVVGLLMLAAIFVALNSAMANARVSKTQEQLSTIRASIQSLYETSADYTGVANAIGITARAFPGNMVDGAGNVANEYNGAVTIQPNAGDAKLFDIVFAAVPDDACLKMAGFQHGEWQTVDINGAVQIPQAPGTNIIGAAAAAGGCDQVANVLTWTTQ